MKLEFPQGHLPVADFSQPVVLQQQQKKKITSIPNFNFSYKPLVDQSPMEEEEVQIGKKRRGDKNPNTFETFLNSHNIPRVHQGQMKNEEEWKQMRAAQYEADKITLQDSLNEMEWD